MALTKAERSARWRAAHPDRAIAYRKSERGRETARMATARWRARHPTAKKIKPTRVAELAPEEQRKKNREYMRNWQARASGTTACTDFPPPPLDNRCQKCRKLCNDTGSKDRLHLDHDHETGAFRGWLCIRCNMGIGQLGDTREGLLTALAYLDGELPWQKHPLPGINGALGFGV